MTKGERCRRVGVTEQKTANTSKHAEMETNKEAQRGKRKEEDKGKGSQPPKPFRLT